MSGASIEFEDEDKNLRRSKIRVPFIQDLLVHVKLRPLHGRRALLFRLSTFPDH